MGEYPRDGQIPLEILIVVLTISYHTKFVKILPNRSRITTVKSHLTDTFNSYNLEVVKLQNSVRKQITKVTPKSWASLG
jgi:hypothetical protein